MLRALTLVAVLACTAIGQDTRMRWSVSAGPSGTLGPSGWVPQGSDPFNSSLDDPIISGANNGRFNLGLGLSRPMTGALQWRLDLLYNLGTSNTLPYFTPCDPANPPEGPFDFCGGPRPALRDELLLGTIGFQWDAFPQARWSPYLLTTAGGALSRLQWNRDHTATRPDETTWSRGVAVGAGVGFRFPLFGREGFLEARRHRTTGVYSSKFVPLAFGLRF